MYQNLRKKTEGFTIIEVLIVLAIAGLIMLIVFLAVPALQRNSRNTQRKNQAGTYASAVSEWMTNNNGKVPTTAADVTAINSLAADGAMSEPNAVSANAQNSSLALDTMQLVTTAKCDTANIGNTVQGSSRNVALRYTVENSSGGATGQCLDI